MPWIEFIDDFTWRVPGERLVLVDYKLGQQLHVTRACAESALAAGKARSLKAPRNRVEAKAVRIGRRRAEPLTAGTGAEAAESGGGAAADTPAPAPEPEAG